MIVDVNLVLLMLPPRQNLQKGTILRLGAGSEGGRTDGQRKQEEVFIATQSLEGRSALPDDQEDLGTHAQYSTEIPRVPVESLHVVSK